MQKTKTVRKSNKFLRILTKSLLFLFLFIVVIFLLLLTPPVQRFLSSRAENYLEKRLGTEVEIGRVGFGLSGNVVLKDIYVEDKTKDTLIAGGTIKGRINFLKLFSNELRVKDLQLSDITLRVKRILPDTVYNFQFIIDAFAPKTVSTDTSSSTPMVFDVNTISLKNADVIYKDVITGSDMFAKVGDLAIDIDEFDPNLSRYDIPTILARDIQVGIRQDKPIITPEPLSKDIAEARAAGSIDLALGNIAFQNVDIHYINAVSAVSGNVHLGELKTSARNLDFANNRIYLDELSLKGSVMELALGKKETTDLIEKEVAQEAEARSRFPWDVRINNLVFDQNDIRFDNQHITPKNYGIDYDHLDIDSFSLHVGNLVLNADSIGGKITSGYLKEKSGFHLQALEGNVLYAQNQAYLQDLYLKTPGTELRRNASLSYASTSELVNAFEKTVMEIDLTDSRVQVKDILAFAPQLRQNRAFSNPNDTWLIDVRGQGTLDRLHLDKLYFNGLANTMIDAEGSLTGLNNMNMAGGNFTIRRLHTTQSDIALFTGKRLSTPQVQLPETMDISGVITGNTGTVSTDLDIRTSSGTVNLDGRFTGLGNPASTGYTASVTTSALNLGQILRQPQTFGSVYGQFNISGKGLTADAMQANIDGQITSIGINRYQYKNLKVSGTLSDNNYALNADINDPNADLDVAISGALKGDGFILIKGMVDSLKTQPLNLTADPLIMRGKIDGRFAAVNAGVPEGELLITNALFVSGSVRQPLDTVQLVSDSMDSVKYIRLNSDIANVNLTGQFDLVSLPGIIQNNIEPYITLSAKNTTPVKEPYDFSFNADIAYSPVFISFVPGLKELESLHAEGTVSSGSGINAQLSSPYINYNGTAIHALNLTLRSTDSGLYANGIASRVKTGKTMDLYNARINATAQNNRIQFTAGVDDQQGKNKYLLSAIMTQPVSGTYAFTILPDSLLLNYQPWTVAPGNELIIAGSSIRARDFVLQKDNQRLALNSIGNENGVRADFTNFSLATITGFATNDSLMADGLINGELTVRRFTPALVFTSDLRVDNLAIRKDTIGNVQLQVSNSGSERYITRAIISGRGNDAELSGSFIARQGNVGLDMNLDIRRLELNSMEALMGGLLANSSGFINGNVKIAGTSSSPDIDGNLNFNNTSFVLGPLGSRFNVDNERINVTNNGFVFDNFTIRDSSNNRMTIDGNVNTANFVNYEFDLDVNARNFQVLNSVKDRDKIYYGKMNITTDLHISGTEVRPSADGNITVNEGTDFSFVIPQAESAIVEREGVIEFVDMDAPINDSLFLSKYDSLNNAGVLGFDVALNIEVKKEAVFNIVVDEANGDFLNVQGEALLTAGIDPSGKITLAGTYTLEQGAYQISFNFLQRKFEIQKGSTILWTGEPTTANLNVSAVYVANTAPLDLVADQLPADINRNIYMQKLPFEVHLNLSGELMRPVIAFDILLPERNYGVSNDIVTAVQSRLGMIRQEEGEVNKQVFSLLLLNRFVGNNPFESGVETFSFNTYARQSVSKLLTEQLNQLAAGLVNGVDINFDVTSAEDYTTGDRRNRTDLNVGISKRLLNDRLKISVGSNFQLEGAQNSSQQNNNIAGNIAVDYQLSRDGRYMLRFYRQNEYQGIVDGYIVETGMSFILSVDYNRFMQIFRKKKRANNAAILPKNGNL